MADNGVIDPEQGNENGNGAENGNGNEKKPNLPATINNKAKEFELDLDDALTPDPGTEDMFITAESKFAYSPGQLSKLLNPKSYSAFYALGGLAGIEKGLRTNRTTGLSVDETTIDGAVAFEDVAHKGAAKYGSKDESAVHSASAAAGSKKGGADPAAGLPPLKTSPGDSFADRKRIFRDNRVPAKKSKSIFQLAWETYNDKVLIFLTVAALISLALGLYQTFGVQHTDGSARIEWVEGVAIMVAIIIVVVVGTVNDWNMERSFRKLNAKHDDRHVKAIRSGKSVEVSVYDLMVGDVMHLSTGDMVPVDGIFIEGHGVKCDESSATGESDLLKKTAADQVFAALEDIHSGKAQHPDIEKLDPFIISGSKVQEGTGTFLVTAVGVNSSYGRIMMNMQTDQEETPLQKKLNRLADMIAWIGMSSALTLFAILAIKWGVALSRGQDADLSAAQKGQSFMAIVVVSITVVVVAVPEGLPLAVTLALSFATNRMTKDNNLVRVLRACETMGNATTVCSDKTGTLTQNKMTVVATTLGKAVSFGGTDTPLEEPEGEEKKSSPGTSTERPIQNVPVEEFVGALSNTTKQLIIQSNAVNSTAFEGDQDGEHTYIGSKTEVALLVFTRDHLGAPPVAEVRSGAEVVQVVPFDSALKCMASVVKIPNGKFRVYVKGASEILLGKCTKVLAEPGSEELTAVELTPDVREVFDHTITSYAGQTLRTIGSSYRDFDSWPPPDAVSKEDPKAGDLAKFHADMTLIGIYGIKDPLRPSVIDAIKDCKRAGVFVRMVTGDNILTAKAIAKECGIYRPQDGGIAMEGPEFRRKSEDELKQLVPKLQVLARSSPEDKRILVRTLKELGETVAVTGDGTNDAPALKMADIGFAMGIAGTEVAKEAAAIILMDDNFASIVKGMMWGRAVNDAVKKFLQFQLTVNVTAVVLTFVSAVASGKEESVLNAVQLLWVNLIMDTFAALALATDPPNRSVLDRMPDRKSAALITVGMAKMIVGQAICQLIITLTLNFGGANFFNLHGDEGEMELKTLVFNTFVWLQIFNEINNRRLDNKLNIFEGITKNWIFLAINLVMVGGQVLIIFVGGQPFKIKPLNGREWGISIGLGAASIPFGAAIRLFPDSWVLASLPYFVRRWWVPETISDEEKAKHPADFATPVSSDDEAGSMKAPLRTLTMIRGERAYKHSYSYHEMRAKIHQKRQDVRAMAHRHDSKKQEENGGKSMGYTR